MLTAIFLITFLAGLFLLIWYWEILAVKDKKKAERGNGKLYDDSENFY